MKRKLTVGILSVSLLLALSGCGTKTKTQEKLHLSLSDTSIQLKDGAAKFDIETNKNAKYKVLDRDNKNAQVGKTYTTKTGDASLTLNSAGNYKIEVTKNGQMKGKKFVVKPTKKKIAEKVLAFGKTSYFNDGDNNVVSLTINSVNAVSADNSMVIDISSNDSSTKQFTIVNYTVKAVKGSIETDAFDGSELSIADAKNTIGSTSSNRDSGTPDSLKQGQSLKLRIGVGFYNDGNSATIGFNDTYWTGKITK